MKHLWAPWRMEYIGGEQQPGCLFCRVIENPDDKDAGLVVWRPEDAIVIMNKFPYNPGHTIVAPKAHLPGLENLDDDQTTHLMRAVRRTIDVLRSTLTPDGFNVGANVGRAAGAGIPDHVHVLAQGRIAKSGGPELALELESRGYGWVESQTQALSETARP